jgi:hypothetical protein
VTSLSESSQGEVRDSREKWGDFWEKLIAINRNIVSRPHGRHVDLIYDSLKPQSLSLESCREHCQYTKM